MRLLVTGADGQVGREIVAAARAREYDVLGLDRKALDITDRQAVEQTVRSTDMVINAAAYTNVDLAESSVDAAFSVNERGVANLAATGCRILHISTDYVFDGTKTTPYVEDDTPAPLSIYGASKLAGERAVVAMNSRHLILRTSWVFGQYGSNFVRSMLRLGREQTSLRIVHDQKGGPTPARSIAEGAVTMAQKCLEPGFGDWGIYHFSGSPVVTWKGFAEEIFQQSNLKVAVSPITTAQFGAAAPRPANSALECNKIRRTFNLRQPDWRSSLVKLIGGAAS